ncbi:MAG: DUF2868 domain-containing protein [Betaproteobacteria bacterium]
MSFDENAALEAAAVRAIESVDRERALWSDDDRAWASRAAAEVVGEGVAPETFLAARARLALERIGQRSGTLPRAVNALRWRPWVGFTTVVVAFAAGVAIDQVGGSQRINLLAPPLFGLLLWNIAVYLVLAVGFVVRYGDAAPVGSIRGLVTRFAGGRARPGRGELAPVIARLAVDWGHLSTPLYRARAARILHVAAATFAAGLVAGLYLRGIALEYRATWESTFLDAAAVRALLVASLAPGAAFTGIPVPSVAEVEAIRVPAGENAGRWLHLMAAAAALVVIVPRMMLALWAWVLERHRGSRLPLAIDEPYFARLLRSFLGGPMHVHVAPYSYTMPAPAAAGLERLIRNVFGASASLTIMAPTVYGGEDALAKKTRSDHPINMIALFNATATPERESHGAFLDHLAARLAPGGTLTALVDEGAFRDRSGNAPTRLEERRALWRALCADRQVACAFAALGAPDLADAGAALERALGEALR